MTVAIIRLNVSDLERARAYYCDALGFSVVDTSRSMRLVLGAQHIELVETDGLPYPAASTAADLWFQHFAIVTTNIDAACVQAMRDGAAVISRGGPQLLPPEAGGVRAFKFRDPDGHPLELLEFPAARRAWPVQSDRLMMGIDHTAISVSDADRSVAFYESLGLSIRARQTNTGPAQERLDSLADVKVEVIAMERPGTPPPHLELLCYRTPQGRKLEQREVYDIADTETILAAPRDADTAWMRDPDSHAVRLVPMRIAIS
jgi:catechol 2,3-dioxygenase-like lactoylglutathione lyase family enzyme